jgi:hypothetical protein
MKPATVRFWHKTCKVLPAEVRSRSACYVEKLTGTGTGLDKNLTYNGKRTLTLTTFALGANRALPAYRDSL